MSREIQIAWAAGLFEGEGCITIARHHGRQRDVLALKLGTTDRDVLDRFHEIVGVGAIHGPIRRYNAKDYWMWQVYARDSVSTVIALFLPYLGERRRARWLQLTDEVAASSRCFDALHVQG